MTASPTAIETEPVKTRLRNSTMALTSAALRGVRWPGSQFGQEGQPRPEPVRRTAPPVTMMTARRTAAASVIRR